MAAVQALRAALRAPVGGIARSRRAKNRGWYFDALRRQSEASEAVPPLPLEVLHGKQRARAFLEFAVGSSSDVLRVELELAVSLIVVVVVR
jgi:hypothetical protein